MSFDSICNDTLTVLKVSGEEITSIKGLVSKKSILIPNSKVLIEPNDLLRRHMSNGGQETYKVIDPNFHENIGGMKAYYQIKYKKLGIDEAENAVKSITYNISGPNARVNNNSVDNSINTVNVNPEISEHLAMLRSEIERLVESDAERKDALEIVDAIDVQFNSDQPSKSVVGTLLKGLPHAGSIAGIGSFLLSCIV